METLLATVVYVSPAAISAGKLSIRLFYKNPFLPKAVGHSFKSGWEVGSLWALEIYLTHALLLHRVLRFSPHNNPTYINVLLPLLCS